ncbi:type 1 glutamine amidotransferase [Algicella marina]|uniref:Type 1 glutamine amidotransferase n=1 Tax=Algicella marina TaxID=2683284 RepID=A0A6P1T6D0_9RHOB|nr:gamma-glutamyl-gamma-aminobutyrate hydrolase family protein [Algicella marina]QHQ37026.1 type 1 glutamine amidotransferase [Algicella marina]
MRIGILKTGNVNEKLAAEFGEYPDLFAAMLGAVDAELEFFAVDVVGGEMPANATEADGWLVTGSRHGVYDDLPWIEPLKALMRQAVAAKIPVVGVCFGHQILADALGGKAEKSDKGWGLGVHEYEPVARPAWMDDLATGWKGHAVHQDQVTVVPPDARVIARSAFCENAALAYGDLDAPDAISVQPHPEFSAGFVEGLINVRLEGIVPDEIVAAARERLGTEVDNAAWAKVMVRFFREAHARRKAPAAGAA